MEELAGRQFGPYRVVAALGQGGMASVYKAFQPAVNRYVALKVLGQHFMTDPQFVQRFRHEAAILAQLQHPHILPVFDFGESDGYAFLTMPFIDGGTLASMLKGRPLPLDVVERVIRQLGDALDYAHSQGIVHRDIKPSNVLLDQRGNCLLADFGIARMVEGASRLTMTGAIIGTPEYMSPEQAAGEKVGAASDIYSLGVVLYEMLTGRVPFKAETPIAIAIKHVTAPLPMPRVMNPALSLDLEAVILKAMARSPADRFSSTADMANQLTTAVRSSLEIQRQATIVELPTRPVQPEDRRPPEGAGAAASAESRAAEEAERRRQAAQRGREEEERRLAAERRRAVEEEGKRAAEEAERRRQAAQRGREEEEQRLGAERRRAAEDEGRQAVLRRLHEAERRQQVEPTRAAEAQTRQAAESAVQAVSATAPVEHEETKKPISGQRRALLWSAAAASVLVVLGAPYLAGWIPGTERREIAEWTRRCDNNDAAGCHLLAGRSNPARAAELYRKSAELYRKTAELTRRACESGSADSCSSLGSSYEHGTGGLPNNEKEAIRWYRRGCEAKGESACNGLKKLTAAWTPTAARPFQIRSGGAVFEPKGFKACGGMASTGVPEEVFSPQWSADGQTAVYASVQRCAPDSRITLMVERSGAEPIQLGRAPDERAQRSLSLDGEWVTFVSDDRGLVMTNTRDQRTVTFPETTKHEIERAVTSWDGATVVAEVDGRTVLFDRNTLQREEIPSSDVLADADVTYQSASPNRRFFVFKLEPKMTAADKSKPSRWTKGVYIYDRRSKKLDLGCEDCSGLQIGDSGEWAIFASSRGDLSPLGTATAGMAAYLYARHLPSDRVWQIHSVPKYPRFRLGMSYGLVRDDILLLVSVEGSPSKPQTANLSWSRLPNGARTAQKIEYENYRGFGMGSDRTCVLMRDRTVLCPQ
jgi:tRNA A-37 threonylcarbamoyl transferase component Bud32